MPALAVPLPKSINRLVLRYPAAREAVVDEAVRILRSRRSLWPVATGRSIRAFRRTGTGSAARIYNPVRYASYVEARNKPAERTLERFKSRLRTTALEARRRSQRGILGARIAREANLEARRSLD